LQEAGGERLRPLTDDTPKPLLPIKGKPMIEWAIDNLKKHGIIDIILSIGYKADMIQEHFGDGSKLGVSISYAIETEPLGTGGAVKDIVSQYDITEPFALVWGDNIADFDFTSMIDVYETKSADLVMALTPREDVENFGVPELYEGKIVRFLEKPTREDAPSNLINAGGFIVNPEILDLLPSGVSSIEKECFEKLCGKEGSVYAFEHEGFWFPTDTLEKYKYAEDHIEV